MALLNIKPAVWPKGATHIGQSGEVIKDNGELFARNPCKSEQHRDYIEMYYIWSRGEWIPRFGRHLAKIVLGEIAE